MAEPAPVPAAEPALVLRPHRLLLVAVGFAVALVVLTLYGWFALPAEVQVLFTLSQRLTLLGVLAVLVGIMFALALSVVRADAAGLAFRNGFRRHSLPWSRVHRVVLRPGDPWAFVLLTPADGGPLDPHDVEKRQLMAVQANDGARAHTAVERLEQAARRWR